MLLTPGWIDLHVHLYDGVSHYGIPADPNCIDNGVTTAVDAGSAGADTFAGFRRHNIDASDTRVFGQLNISSQGMLSPEVGELEDMRWVNVERSLKVIEANRDVTVGVKVRLTRNSICSRESGLTPLHIARDVAEAAGVAVMVHPQDAWADSIDEIVAVLRNRDILTHCFHGQDGCGILDERQRVRSSIHDARARGVVFDVGHGKGSFTWDVAEAALGEDFLPDTISSDLHYYNVDGPVFDLATTATKFIHLGLSLDEVIARVTAEPARTIGKVDIGTLRVGAWGDAAILQLETGGVALTDCAGVTRTGTQRIRPVQVVKDGRIRSRR